MTDTNFHIDAVIAIADAFATHMNGQDISDDAATACLNEAADICNEYGIEEMDARIDLICEGAEWFMDRKKRNFTDMLRSELSTATEDTNA